MKYKWIVKVSYWTFVFDNPNDALRFFKNAMKHYVDDSKTGEYPVEKILDLDVEVIETDEKAEEKPEEKSGEAD